MEYIEIYKCLCDTQRLRILNLLQPGPLCVCHIIEILDAPQVKISKQLRYMKELGLVAAERRAQWMVYRLADPDNPLLIQNLQCLQDAYGDCTCFTADLKLRDALTARIEREAAPCCDALEIKP